MTLRRRQFLRLAGAAISAACVPIGSKARGASGNIPCLLGIDMAGSYHLGPGAALDEDILFWNHPAYFDAVREIGAEFVVVHLFPETLSGDSNAELMAQKIREIDAGMRAHGLKYTLNNEDANYTIRAEITPGVNEYEHAGGLHRWDIRTEWLTPLIEANAAQGEAFLGVTYDECEHMQLIGNQFANTPTPPHLEPNSFDEPNFAVTDGMTPAESYDALVSSCAAIRQGHYQSQVPLRTEHVWSDMYHIFARAGWTVTPKALMLSLTSVSLSIALGAALQYQDRTDFWVLCDMWGANGFPGHSPEALRSALKMGYWLGASALYVENFDNQQSGPSHPLASPPGRALVNWLDPDHYEVTAHGAVVRDFFKNHVPANPRATDWRRYRPRVAIIRLPDGSVGQPEAFFRRRLLGNRLAPMDAISEEWLDVWPILTHGAARPGAICVNNPAYPTGFPAGPDEFFVPINSVAMFDHLVEGPVLDSVDCFVICGHALSAQTFAAVRARVQAGATCVIARRLLEVHAAEAPAGNWVVIDSFEDEAVAAALAPFLGPPDAAIFRFSDRTVTFRPGGAPQSVTVEITTTSAEKIDALLGLAPIPPDADTNGDGAFDISDVVGASV